MILILLCVILVLGLFVQRHKIGLALEGLCLHFRGVRVGAVKPAAQTGSHDVPPPMPSLSRGCLAYPPARVTEPWRRPRF